MRYIVSGIPRSGTSMMMQMLQAGGIPLFYSEQREAMLREKYNREHEANPNGFFELRMSEAQSLCFSDKIPEGHAATIFTEYLPILGAEPTKVVWMEREPEEIRLSQLKVFNIDLEKKHPNWPKYYYMIRDKVRSILDDRRSIEYIEINHRDCIDDVASVVSRLSGFIPVSSSACAAVDRGLHRWRQ